MKYSLLSIAVCIVFFAVLTDSARETRLIPTTSPDEPPVPATAEAMVTASEVPISLSPPVISSGNLATRSVVAAQSSESAGTQGEISDDTVEVSAVTTYATSAQAVVRLYRVLRVVDGDTIEVATDNGPKRVRYIGVDTPETVHPSRPVECMGHEASAFNRTLVEGKLVRLETDVSDVDRYDRWLRYVYVDDVLVNEALVLAGYANVVTYPPDVKYIDQFRVAEAQARAAGVGLWSALCATSVSARVAIPPAIAHSSPTDPSCRIKGNINISGEKIFHVPGCQSYDKTIVSEAVGERWFCTENEAVAAGWRKALNCT